MRKIITRYTIFIAILAVIILISYIYSSETECETEQLYIDEEPYEEPYEVMEPEKRSVSPAIAALRERYNNNDIVGYLYIEGTNINYPVTQYTDNEFYLHHDIEKRRNRAGWIFLDYENDITKEDRNVVIYGHNTERNNRFHHISRFVNRDFFDAHRYITFNTAYAEYRWEIFSFYRTGIDFFYIQVFFDSYEEFYELLAEMKARSMHDSGIEVGPGDRVLTLSTCVNNPANERYVINARLIRND